MSNLSEEEKKAIDNLKFCCINSEMVKVYDIQTVLKLIEKQKKEIKEKNKLVLHMKERLNNISFEVECMWRKIEKVENRYE